MTGADAALPAPPEHCDVAVVGGGILGLAVARELLGRRPGARVCVLEREGEVGMHQTSHNSGVIHAGIYYAPGSPKARLCVEGSRELLDYCEQHAIPTARCGKVILATHDSELPRLDELERRARANGVSGVRRIGAAAIAELEPHARGIAALHSPATAITDFRAVAAALSREILCRGGAVATGCGVESLTRGRRSLLLSHARGRTEAGNAVFCAGAWADRLAVADGAGPDPRILPFRGSYMRLRPARRELVRGLIYPVPDPTLPFLGVHLTRTIGGEVLIGPTAVPAGARDGYRATTVRPREVLETLAWPGTWRMLARWWRTGLSELRLAALDSAFVAAAARYVPELGPEDVTPAFAGVRAQALARDGTLLDEFAFSQTERALHVRNAPSPAATSSLAIARHVADALARLSRH